MSITKFPTFFLKCSPKYFHGGSLPPPPVYATGHEYDEMSTQMTDQLMMYAYDHLSFLPEARIALGYCS